MQNLFTRNCMQKLNLKSSTIRREKRNFIYISEQLSRALRSSVFRHIREQRYIKLVYKIKVHNKFSHFFQSLKRDRYTNIIIKAQIIFLIPKN